MKTTYVIKFNGFIFGWNIPLILQLLAKVTQKKRANTPNDILYRET